MGVVMRTPSSVVGLFVVGLLSTAGCSLLVDHSNVQCKVDADCDHFGGHPACEDGVCVASGLGPEGCFAGTPVLQSDYLNACSRAANQPFDNCARLGMCAMTDSLPTAIMPTNPAIPPLVNPVAVPTVNCSDVAANRIYMYGTSDFAPMLKAAQPLLSAGSPSYRAFYLNASSCAGVISVFDATKHIISNPAPGATPNYAFYYDDSGAQQSCLLDSTGNTVDIGVSNLFSQTCNTATATYVSGTTVSDYTGPIVPFALSVPSASSQTVDQRRGGARGLRPRRQDERHRRLQGRGAVDRSDLLLHPQLELRLDGADGAAHQRAEDRVLGHRPPVDRQPARFDVGVDGGGAVDRHPVDRRRRHQPRQPAQPLPAVAGADLADICPTSTRTRSTS